jgi:hypothetical protein
MSPSRQVAAIDLNRHPPIQFIVDYAWRISAGAFVLWGGGSVNPMLPKPKAWKQV